MAVVKTTVVLRSRIPQIIAGMEPRVGLAVGAGAKLISQAAKEKVPTEHGDLKKAIHVSRRKTRARIIAGKAPDVFYGHLVERGTAEGQAPQPFMVPAAEENKDAVVELVAVALRTL